MRWVFHAAAAVTAALLVGCATPNTAIVKIGHVGPLTGPMASLGVDNERGARLAVEELNAQQVMVGGRRVVFELHSEDDRGDPKAGVAAAQRLANARVAAVVGHLNSGTSVPSASVYARAGIPAITPSATNPRLTRMGHATAFRLIADDYHVGTVLGRYAAVDLASRRIAVVDDRTAYGEAIANQFSASAKASGATIVTREFVSQGTTDFSPVLDAVKAHGAELVFYGGMDSEATVLLQQMRGRGLQTPVMGGDGICTSSLGRQPAAGVGNDRVYCAEPGGIAADNADELAQFNARFLQRFGSAPVLFAPYAYDAVKLIAAAMEKADSTEPNAYMPVLAKTADWQGVTGTVSFDAKGDIMNGSVTLFTYRDGKRVRLGVQRSGDAGPP